MNPVATTEPPAAVAPEKNRFLSREDMLSAANNLQEKEVEIKGLGTLLLSEVTAEVRANLIGQQATGMMADQKKFDRNGYERTLVQAGVMDPTSPPGGRSTLFRMGDMDRVMRIGGSKIAEIVESIEKLSSLGEFAGSAEGNSGSTPNGDGIS